MTKLSAPSHFNGQLLFEKAKSFAVYLMVSRDSLI